MKIYLIVVTALLLGCQQTSAPLLAENSHEPTVKRKIICPQSTTPPLKNTQKLKEMLIANGKIDASLSDKEIEREVKAYIRKKNSAFNNCKK
jgi:hypothetical protein